MPYNVLPDGAFDVAQHCTNCNFPFNALSVEDQSTVDATHTHQGSVVLGSDLCPRCATELHLPTCSIDRCNARTDELGHARIQDRLPQDRIPLCASCITARGMVLCRVCHVFLLAAHASILDGAFLCHRCTAERTETCNLCHTMVPRESPIWTRGLSGRCYNCSREESDEHFGGRIREGLEQALRDSAALARSRDAFHDDPSTEDDEDFYPDEEPETNYRSHVLHNYGQGYLDVTMHGDGPHYGIELETHTTKTRTRIVPKVYALLKGCTCERDSSLDSERGFEIKMPPMQFDKLLDYAAPLFAARTDLGLFTDDRAGMHVNVNMGSFSRLGIAKALMFLSEEDTYTFVSAVAGRGSVYHANKPDKDTLTRITRCHRDRHYSWMNVKWDRVEFRMFKAPVGPIRFNLRLEFIRALVAFVRPCNTSVHSLRLIDFFKFVHRTYNRSKLDLYIKTWRLAAKNSTPSPVLIETE